MSPSHQPKWTEASLTRGLVRSFFNRAVLAIPCCTWTGHEADVLVVTKDCRLIDVEVKISRADLLADAKKEKWWLRRPWYRSRTRPGRQRQEQRLDWPPRVWKHYYLMPADIWKAELADQINPTSGILLAQGSPKAPQVFAARKAKPNKDADVLLPRECIDLARLAGLRLWDALLAADGGIPQPTPKGKP